MERARKRQLRDLNTRVWAGEKDVLEVQGSLDSSMKKNTAFIKRLRTGITAPSLSTFLAEIKSLSLHKYLSELISACYEGLCKLKTPADIAAGVEIVSALHQRFGPAEFTGYFGWHVGRGLATPDKSHLKALAPDVREREEKERLTRQRGLLRVATELWLVGVLRSLEDIVRPEEAGKAKDAGKVEGSAKGKASAAATKTSTGDAEPFPLEVLKDMLGHDREHINLPLVVLFVKTFAWDILGVKVASSEGRKTVQEDGATTVVNGKLDDGSSNDEEETNPADPSIIGTELQQRFKNILTRYFEDVKAHIIKDQKSLANQEKRNAEAYVRSGEIFEDRQANYEKQVKSQEKLVSNTQILADVLGLDMPDLKEKDTIVTATDGNIGLVKAGEYLRGQGDGAGIWEDEDERRFYENLVDLKDRVPGILLEDSKKKKADGPDEQVGKRNDAKAPEADTKEKAEATPDKTGDGDEQSTAIANKTVGAQVDGLLARLPDLTTKEQVDELAIDFCFLNSKASRNRMIKAVQEVPKSRSDLLPLYARLVATLSKYMPDIPSALVTYLDDEFRSLQRRKQKDFLGQVRTQNIRYLAELTKFGVVPEHIIFHCFKVSLDDFSRMNIEIMSNLLENCGRYLLRNPETSPRMASFLETLNRKKGAQHLGSQERMLIENAVYYVNPPERTAVQPKERTPVDMFVRKLVYLDLTKRNLDKIVKQIRKLHWEEQEVIGILRKIFTKPGKIKYSNIHLLAVILGSLHRYHQEFTISCIDDLLESITFGLELNDFKFNQRRIAEVKYLGELYIYRMVDSPVIFETLYRIVGFGHERGTPKPGVINPFDLPDDFFRVRLICNLLETCGVYYNKGVAKKKLDFFLSLFQYYIFTKEPMPMDVEFVVQDAFASIRPQWKVATSLEEAGREFAEACKQNYQTAAAEKAAEAEESEESTAEDDGDGPDDEEIHIADGEDTDGEEAEVAGEDEPQRQESDSEEEHIVVTRPEDERDPEADAEFDRELAKMMAESLETRKSERKPVFDIPLPIRRGPIRDANTPDDSGTEGQEGIVKFTLLSRRGNKQQNQSIDLPSDSTFAVEMRKRQEAEKAEQQRIKNLVLNLDLRDDNDDGDNPFPSPPRNKPIPGGGRKSQYGNSIDVVLQGNDSRPTNLPIVGGSSRIDKAGSSRAPQRARKLQLSDVDWYDNGSFLAANDTGTRRDSGVATGDEDTTLSPRSGNLPRQGRGGRHGDTQRGRRGAGRGRS